MLGRGEEKGGKKGFLFWGGRRRVKGESRGALKPTEEKEEEKERAASFAFATCWEEKED